MSATPRELQSGRPTKACIRAGLMNLLPIGSTLIATAQPIQTSQTPWETKADLRLTSTPLLKPQLRSLQAKSMTCQRAKPDQEHQNKIIKPSPAFQEVKLEKDLAIARRCISQNIWISPYSIPSTHLRKSQEDHLCRSKFHPITPNLQRVR